MAAATHERPIWSCSIGHVRRHRVKNCKVGAVAALSLRSGNQKGARVRALGSAVGGGDTSLDPPGDHDRISRVGLAEPHVRNGDEASAASGRLLTGHIASVLTQARGVEDAVRQIEPVHEHVSQAKEHLSTSS